MWTAPYNLACSMQPAGRALETLVVNCVWNVMAHAQKPDYVFPRNGRVHLNRGGRQFCRLLAGELYTSARKVCTARASLCSAVMWRLLVTHSIFLFPLHFSSRTSQCAITFQLDSKTALSDDNACDITGIFAETAAPVRIIPERPSYNIVTLCIFG